MSPNQVRMPPFLHCFLSLVRGRPRRARRADIGQFATTATRRLAPVRHDKMSSVVRVKTIADDLSFCGHKLRITRHAVCIRRISKKPCAPHVVGHANDSTYHRHLRMDAESVHSRRLLGWFNVSIFYGCAASAL